ncbi:uncharacterized protein LOC133200337 [Saccostrea echinata]|uniref:uncharacterized protein LOC133200337 n=1 Tax=Saccostrea echinata TaxID=191078 RepID=UPI002A8150A3|nr:uncharacterized protein LOC133200337 [Saccostrea echinata]
MVNFFIRIQDRKRKTIAKLESTLSKVVNFSNRKNSVVELTCSQCYESTTDLYRCLDCIGSWVVCEGCLHSNHSHPHLHVIEKWMNGTFIGYQCEKSVWCSMKHKHFANKYIKDLVVIDDKGRQHLRTIEFCTCEEEPVTLIDFDLWPSSPMYPKIAFHFDLLRWLNGLMLESHVSAKSFCEALTARLPKQQKKYTSKEEKEIYKVLMEETIHQFRHFCYKMDFCERFDGLDDGCSCPACYQTDTPFYYLDADFQLVRKTSSGKSWLDPKHSENFFVQQDKVDDFFFFL